MCPDATEVLPKGLDWGSVFNHPRLVGYVQTCLLAALARRSLYSTPRPSRFFL